ncbi:hypothetical protein PVAP13_5NG275620 [Panicum virgatum]|uniref:GDSL esterase/lipase n=1 Tax=Panicum virgatum TaxID=38727 RepID=A0A8T0RVA8_PANVG|nr:hypothetical protein PVAP13_5NG275620 [Panicum virgatum]
MSTFKCGPHSLPGAIILALVVLLFNPHVGLCSCYKRIFSFGDSIIDTGNFVHLAGKAASKYKEPPYGMTFFKNATGRICDGRVLIDFYGAQAATDAADSAKQGLGRVPAWCQLCRAWCHGERRSLHEE